MTICSKTFRKTMGAFPTGVTIVTTQTPEGVDIGLTISSFTSLSLEPPQILFCLTKSSQSVPFFTPGNCFAVNVLSSHQASLSNHFASGVPTNWNSLPCHPHEHAKCMLIDETLAQIVCEVSSVLDGGDHTIIIGRIIDLIRNEEEHLPLVRHLSSYKGVESLEHEDDAEPRSYKRLT